MRWRQSPITVQWVLILHIFVCWPRYVCRALESETIVDEEPTQQPKSRFPTEINLRAAVLHAPPFATVEELDDGSVVYGGFQADMLRRLQVFAAADNVTLNFNLSVALPQYGPSLDLVANDCAEVVENPEDNCGKLDLIVGNYYATPDRALRVDLSPAWLRSTISTIKYLGKTGADYSTLSQAEAANAWVCLKDGTFYAGVVKAKFPRINYHFCPSQDECLAELKAEKCVLYASDELQLRYRAAWDPSLEVTREQFNTQYIVWPRSYAIDPIVSILLNRWVLAAVTNATLDELYATYFQKALCPVGTAGEACEWPCDPDHGYADANGVCVCQSTKWTGGDCSIEVKEDTNLIPPTLLAMAYVMLGINIAAIVGCVVWLIWQRKSTQVRVSQPFFLNLVLLGCLISSFTIVPLAQQNEGDGPVPACMAIPWLYSVGFSITFGTLFAKIRRVYVIFKSAIDMRRNVVTFKETLSVIGTVLFVDVIILIVWTAVDPLEWERRVINADQFGETLESVGYCNSDHWMVFAGCIAALHLLLLGTACVMCYISRSIPTKFSEGKYVSIAMISNLQIFVVGVPILVMLGTDSQTGFFVRCVIIWMNDLAVVALIFGNLMYSVHWAPSDSDDKGVKAVVSNAVREYSRSSRMLSGRNMGDSSRGLDSTRRLDGSGGNASSSYGRTGSSGHVVPQIPEPIARKSSHENVREQYKERRIPPMIIENGDIPVTTSTTSGGSLTNSPIVTRVARPSIEPDAIGDKSSWAMVTTSSMFEMPNSASKPTLPSLAKDEVERDVLVDRRESPRSEMHLSAVLHEDEGSSKCTNEISQTSLNCEDDYFEDDIEAIKAGLKQDLSSSHLSPIEENGSFEMSSERPQP